MKEEQMRAEFEQVFPALNKTAYNATLGYYLSTEEVSPYYEQTIREHNCRWQAWQACCKKQEDRIAESTLELSDLLEGALVALEQREEKCEFVVDLTGLEYMDDYGDFYMPPNEVKARIEAAGGSVKT